MTVITAAGTSGCGDSTQHTEYYLPRPEMDASIRGTGGRDVGDAGSGSGGSPGIAPPPGGGGDTLDASGEIVSEFLARADGDWLSLVEVEWKLPANSEAHLCARVTVPRDAYLHELAPVIPTGTHHTVLSVHPGGEAPDGVVSCGADVSGRQIFGSGVGSKTTVLPDGIAVQVRAGEQMMLNLHLFNSTDAELTGRSGVRVHTMDEAEVKDVAEDVLAGPLALSIPPGGPTKQGGQCTFDHDSTIISVGPHMHQLGVHMLITAHSSEAGDVKLFDGAYEFDSQRRYPVDFVKMKTGDVVSVECTYQNDTGHDVSWGQSSLDEMCFAGITRFPAGGGPMYLCTN